MRTLVLSDLHLGTHGRADVLRDPTDRARLVAALGGYQRLVLLGDVLELRHGPLREAMAAARRPLGEIGAALGPGAEVVLLAGNHDHHLVESWMARRAAHGPPPPLGTQAAVDWRDDEPLAALAQMLAPAQVTAAYPGLWLRDDVYATHGHYLDLHLTVPTLERLGAGVMRRVVATLAAGPASAEDYETVLMPLYAWVHAIAQLADADRSRVLHGGSVRGWQALAGPWRRRPIRRAALAAGFRLLVGGLNRAGLGPLRAEISGPELRRSGLRALAEVVRRLEIGSSYVIFGHTHRAGPLPSDDPAAWTTAAGAQLINAGCWVQEPAFLGPDPSQSPYRPGFGVVVEDSDLRTPPRLVNLLDRPVPA